MDTDARPQRARLVEDIAHADREDRDPQTPCGRDVAAPRQPERHVIENEEGRRREVARRRAGDAIRVPRLDPRLGAAGPRSGAADLRRALQPAAPPFALSASLHRWPNLRSPIPVDPHDVRRRACSVGSSTNTNESLRDGFGVSDPHGVTPPLLHQPSGRPVAPLGLGQRRDELLLDCPRLIPSGRSPQLGDELTDRANDARVVGVLNPATEHLGIGQVIPNTHRVSRILAALRPYFIILIGSARACRLDRLGRPQETRRIRGSVRSGSLGRSWCKTAGASSPPWRSTCWTTKRGLTGACTLGRGARRNPSRLPDSERRARAYTPQMGSSGEADLRGWMSRADPCTAPTGGQVAIPAVDPMIGIAKRSVRGRLEWDQT